MADVRGLVGVSSTGIGALRFAGTLVGLLPGSGGWHVHAGHSCSASAERIGQATGPHYFPGMDPDPWNPVQYFAGAAGIALLDFTIDKFSLYDTASVIGQTLVVHDTANARAGCGVIGTPQMGVATMGPYPGPDGEPTIGGTLRVTHDALRGELLIEGVVTGLATAQPRAGGWHVHTGFTCTTDDALNDIGGHYFPANQSDPWNPFAYIGPVAHVSARVRGYSLVGDLPVLGRAIVFHNGNGARVGCGLIDPLNGEAVTMGTYPGYDGASDVSGLLLVKGMTGGGLQIFGTLAGLPQDATGGWHIHSGYTCSEAGADLGHYFPTLPTDPWNDVKYNSDANGVAPIRLNISRFSLYADLPVAGRALVVHDTTKAGCGVIGSPTSAPQLATVALSAYPGTMALGASGLGGTLAIEYLPGADLLTVRGLITGLNASTSGGWHIHAGFSCAADGSHYFTPGTADAWAATTYTADRDGIASS